MATETVLISSRNHQDTWSRQILNFLRFIVVFERILNLYTFIFVRDFYPILLLFMYLRVFDFLLRPLLFPSIGLARRPGAGRG